MSLGLDELKAICRRCEIHQECKRVGATCNDYKNLETRIRLLDRLIADNETTDKAIKYDQILANWKHVKEKLTNGKV